MTQLPFGTLTFARALDPAPGLGLADQENTMRKFIIVTCAIAALGTAGQALAMGKTAKGAIAGAAAGAVVAGPVGAVVGAGGGAVIGNHWHTHHHYYHHHYHHHHD
jgi:hypothetical protein